jgi:hypothetical protein
VAGPIFSRKDVPHLLFDGLPFLRNEVSRTTLPVKAKKRNALLAQWSRIASSFHGSCSDRPASFQVIVKSPGRWKAPLCQIISFAASARPQVHGNPANNRPLTCFPSCTPTHQRIGYASIINHVILSWSLDPPCPFPYSTWGASVGCLRLAYFPCRTPSGAFSPSR